MKSGDWLSISHCSRTRTRSPLLEPRSLTASSGLQTSIAAAMVLTNFNGAGVGFGFGAGCGFGVGWGFGGGDCGVGLGLGWGFGTAFGSQYHSSGVTFQGIDFGKKEHDDAAR